MMCFYTISPATAGNLTTNGTPATETDAFFVKAGSGRDCQLQKIDVVGKGAGLTSLSGIAFRLCKFSTASTSGTGMTPAPTDVGAQAAKCTSASRPTAGSTRTNRAVFGCGAAGPGGWIPARPEAAETLEAGFAGSIDMMDISGTASLVYEFSAGIAE
jgi:hypothetical protein